MLKKFCLAMLTTVMVSGVASGFSTQRLSLNAIAAENILPIVNSLPVSVLNDTFDFDDADIGKEIGGWNNWIKKEGDSQHTPDSEFALGKDADGNKVAVIKRTAASTTDSRDYQVEKTVDVGYGTERIGIGFRIKSMDLDNGSFQLILKTDAAEMIIQVNLSTSEIHTPEIHDSFISLSGNESYEVAPLDKWHTVEIIIDTNIKQVDYYTGGVYRGSSDIANLEVNLGGDVLNGKIRAISISTPRVGGVRDGGDSAKMYVDDVTVKTDGTPAAKITQTEITDGKLGSITVKKIQMQGKTES